MARSFVPASTTYLDVLRPSSGRPTAMTCMAFPDSSTIGADAMGEFDSGGNLNRRTLGPSGDVGGDPVHCQEQSGGGLAEAFTTDAFSITAWQSFTGVFASSTSRTVYRNGGADGTNTTSVAEPVGTGTTTIGRYGGLAGGSHFSGLLAECAIFSLGLTAREAVSAKNAVPPLVNLSLSQYWPLWPGNPFIGLLRAPSGFSGTLTNNGTTEARHSPTFMRHDGGG